MKIIYVKSCALTTVRYKISVQYVNKNIYSVLFLNSTVVASLFTSTDVIVDTISGGCFDYTNKSLILF